MTYVHLTIDLEDPMDTYVPNGRYVKLTEKLLDIHEKMDRRATFFTVGRVADAAPSLIKEIAARGHEVAYHSREHIPLTEDTPANFRRQSRDDKDKLEQLTGKAVIGYRAPCFSLIPRTLWATQILAENGFRYSSSIMPTNISRYGYPRAPRHPFVWPSGLREFPLPVGQLGPFCIPYLGGIYLYLLPDFINRRLLGQVSKREVLWTYAHPYDFDVLESFKRMPRTPLWANIILWLARRKAWEKIRPLMELPKTETLGERVEKMEKKR